MKKYNNAILICSDNFLPNLSKNLPDFLSQYNFVGGFAVRNEISDKKSEINAVDFLKSIKEKIEN